MNIGKKARKRAYRDRVRLKKKLFGELNACYLCFRTMTFHMATFDHIVPLRDGGPTWITTSHWPVFRAIKPKES